ncbi:MAG: Pseudouridine-5'-phosphate glycosidase [Alphaproteobacteria bacterium MarineAlpha5_Bin6]|nr:MAG: Pseudouridine-5'-phosphate glycosidase [Alphaproteobacteria bacterium MarineAlpha5_Bin7]PPR53784.1 MAG: Pseudouridine-5'-phosphate glycosidase [Alphaproteobacteria bacterium MarineAlpha5_Bin6]|tara:strand:+ start:241 stop:1152 length:912 start_codon:yes stop_codon:yes gene_type:complete
MKNLIKINKSVQEAISLNKPIVALESTLISHGLPYPDNIKVAKESIMAVQDNGAVAATIGIINGKIKIGLSEEDIEILAKDKNVQKVSNHNFSLSIYKKQNASTTVASTLSIASIFNIKFFATGGIGGVHLNVDKTYDISADLHSLSENTNYVICSGAKSILDLNKTFELLETLSITRVGYKANYMPGFWYPETDNKLDNNFDQISEICSFLKINEKMKRNKSILIFNKVPKENALKKVNVDNWIKKSIKIAKENKISGKDLTPFLINEINKESNNQTLKANISLIISNADLAGKLSREFFSS